MEEKKSNLISLNKFKKNPCLSEFNNEQIKNIFNISAHIIFMENELI